MPRGQTENIGSNMKQALGMKCLWESNYYGLY